MMNQISDVLATRYASQEMRDIWSPEAKIILEREFWIAVLKAQQSLGIDIPQAAIEAYQKSTNKVDLASIAKREQKTKHDVKARIEEFNELAGFEHIHKGLTSRDLTENIEQMQIKKSLELVQNRVVTILASLSRLANEHKELVITGRSHNVAAQVTTLGKRFATTAQEQLLGFNRLTQLLATYPARGLKGPVGTAQDALDLLDQDESKLRDLEETIAQHLGFHQTLTSVGQIYPRSLDYEVATLLYQLASPASSLATTIRLMAGFELVSEGFADGQVGSSAMPHKVNARSSERINGLHVVLNGYVSMLADISGKQWAEGDVSCSVVRRVALPGMFFAFDAIVETFLTVLQGFSVHETAVKAEVDRFLPFLATTKVLMAAVQGGVGRETAHKLIQEHALAATSNLRDGAQVNDFFKRLSADTRLGIDLQTLNSFIESPITLVGAAVAQVDQIVSQCQQIVTKFPDAKNYQPSPIL
jgi:adenylosuccinate lyase